MFVVLRVGFGLFALFMWTQVALPGPCHFEVALDGWRTIPPLADSGPSFPLIGVWQRWDACWYSKVATFGYEPYEDSANFFPLMPALMHLVAVPLGGNVALSGLIVAGVAYIAAAMGLHRLVARDLGRPTARRAVLYLSIAPASFFLFAPFTEALFLALSVWAILAARERAWAMAGVAGGLAALTRIQGVFLVLPLAWEAWRTWRDAGGGVPRVGARGRWLEIGAAVASPGAAFVGFLAYTSRVAGRTPLDTQDIWGGRNFHPPWEVVDASWRWILEHHDSVQAVNLFMLLLFGALVVAGLRYLPVSYSLFAVPQVLLIATRVQPIPLTSTARLLEVVFPAFVVASLAGRYRSFHQAWVILSMLIMAALLVLYLRGDFVA